LNRARDFGIAAALTALVVVLYRKVLRLWWTYDDAYLLHLAIDHPLADSFFSSSVWPQKLFTPIVMLVFETEMAVFGLAPARWFVVHLIAAAIAAIAFYAALRLWFSPWPAGTAAVLFLSCVPFCSLITELGGIHYLVGITLGSIATIGYVAALRRGRWLFSLGSSLLYLLAMLAKETIIPLPFLLVALPERDLGTRVRHVVPHAVSLVVYFAWRYAVIDTFLGGYGWAIDRNEWPRLIASLPVKILLACAGHGMAIGVSVIVLMSLALVMALRRKNAVILFLVAMALAVGPILPVSKEMQRRYALMPWLCWSVAFVAGAEVLRSRNARIGATVLIGVPVLMLVVNRQEWGYEFGRTQRMSDEARFFYDMPPNSYLRGPSVPPAAMGELNWLKTVHERKPSGASWFYDDYFLCTGGVEQRRTWQYDPERRAIVEITGQLPALGRRHCGSIRNTAPLSAEFEYRNGSLFWTLGPYEEGRYRVLMANGAMAFDVPRADGFRLPDMPGIALRIRYDSPEKWTTYSPEITVDFKNPRKTVWTR